tara:strand:+ start:655 stop:897 length:243 start_codon:yes stop_codon:yes gene_type:complete
MYIMPTKTNRSGMDDISKIFFVNSSPSTNRNNPGKSINNDAKIILNRKSGFCFADFIPAEAKTYAQESYVVQRNINITME